MYRKSTVMHIVALFTMVVVLSACQGTPSETVAEVTAVPEEVTAVPEEVTAVPEEPAVKEITTWNLGVGDEAFQLEILRLFNESHPDMKINYDPAAAGLEWGAEGLQKLAIAWANDSGPDFVGDIQVGAGLRNFVDSGELLDLSEAYEARGWNEALPKEWIEWVTVNDKQYAVPVNVHHSGLFYNKEIFAELGLEVPRSWAEFETVLQTLDQAGYVPFAVGLGNGWPADYLAVNYMYGAGGDELIAAMTAKEPWTECEACLAGLTNLDTHLANYANDEINGLSHDQAAQLFYERKAAMQFRPSGWQGIHDAEFDWGFFVMPRPNENQRWTGVGGLGGAFVVSADSQYPEVAYEFFDWFYSQDIASKVFQETLTTLTFTFTPPEDMDPKLAALYEVVSTHAPTAGETNTDYMASAPGLELRPLVQGMASDELTPEEVLAGMQKAHEAWLAEQ